jgi:hypothetical protein
MKLKFGKYKDWELRDVPRDYLEWYISSQNETVREFKAELERRDTAEEASLSFIERIVTTGYRELAKKNHPDLGGDTDAMKQVNAAAEALRELIRRSSYNLD